MLNTVGIVELWTRYLRSSYPKVEDVVRLDRLFEPKRFEPAFEGLNFVHVPVSPRLICKNEEEGFLVQLQDDRIALNWVEGNTRYPAFVGLLARFKDVCDAFEESYSGSGTIAPNPDLFEITYVNKLSGKSFSSIICEHFSGFGSELCVDGTETEELFQFQRVFSRDLGRVYLNVAPDIQSKTPSLIASITSRVHANIISAGDFDIGLNMAHDYAKNVFDRVFRAEKKNEWGIGNE